MRQSFALPGTGTDFQREVGNTQDFSQFWKELIPEGVYKHPTRGFSLEVTRERMDGWVSRFEEQKKRNIRIPIPFGHSYAPERNAGFTERLEVRQRDDGKFALYGLLDIPKSDDAAKIGTTIRDVSVSVNPQQKWSNSE